MTGKACMILGMNGTKAFLKIKKDLISLGFEVTDIEINLDELIKYCKIRGIKKDGKARSQFVQDK
ncbi:MAG: hypothetical protein IMY72_05340 [Bacteroidetes bacterium]|nr:hypothetical protein [Bacteroidota bacterium]